MQLPVFWQPLAYALRLIYPPVREYLNSVVMELNPLARFFAPQKEPFAALCRAQHFLGGKPMKFLPALPPAYLAAISLVLAVCPPAVADEPATPAVAKAKPLTPQEASAKESAPRLDLPDAKEPEGIRRLLPKGNVWIDPKNQRVLMVGEVCLREGQLEMFACLKGTKEHEAIVAVPTKAFVVHAALMALGAEPGGAAKFVPKYSPAAGPRVDVTLFWTDAQGKRHQAAAQDWIRNSRTEKPMTDYWVFGGSDFYVDEEAGQRYYRAEDGDFICISNFNSAMLDLPIESSQSNEALLFQALTASIPPVGTKVTLALTPRLEPKKPGAKPAAKQAEVKPVSAAEEK